LPSGRVALITDTVGFLRDLPQGLVDAFRSTLDELAQSRLLVHIVDVSVDDWAEKEQAVLAMLEDLEASAIGRITLYNKADLVDRAAWQPVIDAHPGEGRLVSVHQREDRNQVRSWIDEVLARLAEVPASTRALS
jgi:GTP-binding protein HflX